jgi:hypothetical protein
MQTIDDQAQEALLRTHFRRLREIDQYSVVPIVTVIESNLSWVVVRA